MTKKTLKDFLEVYKPKSPDEQKFVDKHVTIKHKDRNGNGDDVFNGNTKTIKRKEERHGYDVGEDEKVYEEVEQVEERWSENSKKTSKNLAAMALDTGNAVTGGLLSKSKLARKAMKWADSPDETTSKSRLKAYQARQARKANEEVEDLDEAKYEKQHIEVTSHLGHKRLVPVHPLNAYKALNHYRGLVSTKSARIVSEEVDIEAVLDEALDLLMSIDEKTLTPAEMKKREEVVKAIKRDDPKMDKSMAYAIATKTAKRVAEGTMPTADEPTEADKKTAQKVRDLLAKEKKPVKEEIDKDLEDELKATRQTKKSVGGKWKSVSYKTADGKWASKDVKEEAEDLDESAKIAAHLIKRYGDNVRKSHVRSAANDFGVGYVALSHAVRKKLGVNRLEEEQIDELSKKTLGAYGSKALRAGLSGDEKSEKRMKGANLASAKMYPSQYEKSPLKAKVVAKEEVEELDEISAKKLTDYTAKASDARGHRDMPTVKLDKRYKSVALAHEKIRGRHAKVPANEEVEQIDELSKKTLSSYAKKATNQAFGKGVAGGAALASSNKETEAQGHALVNKAAKRMAGAQKAIGKLTKEDIINRTIEKYVPEEIKFTPEERLLKRLNGLSEAHIGTLLGLFEALNKDNQNKMIETVETREGINQLLNFALENRGE